MEERTCKDLYMMMIAVKLIIIVTLIMVFALRNDGESSENSSNTFCSTFGIADGEARRRIAQEFDPERTLYSFPTDLTCVPEGAFNALSSAEVSSFLLNPVSTIFMLNTNTEAIHPNAFVSKVPMTNIESILIAGTQISEIPENLFASFETLVSLRIRDNPNLAIINDQAMGNVTTLRELQMSGTSSEFRTLPLLVQEQTRLLDLDLVESGIELVESGFLSNLKVLEEITLFGTPLLETDLSSSDLGNLFGVNERVIDFESREKCFESFDFFFVQGLFDNEIRKQVSKFLEFDQDTKTLFVGGGMQCFPNNLFEPLSKEEEQELFPTSAFSINFQNPLRIIRGDTFSQKELYGNVTSVSFTAPIFDDPKPFPDNLFQHFDSLEELVISEAGSGAFSETLDNNFFGDVCTLVSMRFINIFGFTSFPESLRFCEGIEELDFSGSRDFTGENSQILTSLPALDVLRLTGTSLAISNSTDEIAQLLGVSEDIIEV